jgi:signal peptidase I
VIAATNLHAARRWLLSSVRIVLWVFTNVTMLLSAWVILGWSIAGWSPVVVMSGSMEPTVGTGDVLMVDTASEQAIGQRSIIVFERGGETIAHRVFAVEEADLVTEFVTKGDANPSPDSARVDAAEVRGTGRLIVPLVGLPVVWWQEGDWLPLAGWVFLIGVAAVRMALGADRLISRLRRSRSRDDASTHAQRHPVGRVAIQRVRVLIAVLIIAQYALDRDRVVESSGSIGSLALVVAAVVTLAITNVLASWADRDPRMARVGALIELAVDTALVVVLATAAGASGFGWVLFSLPIIEAAVRFRLVGALVHWMLLTLVTLAAEILTAAGGASQTGVDDLESVLDQLSVLFLVVVPAAYLAEQLLGEVTTWQHATGQALDRSQLLVRVADLGRDIVRLDGGHISAILEGTRSLGFARADVVVEEAPGAWRVIDGDALPTPGAAGSGVRDDDRDDDLGAGGGAYVDIDDPDRVEAEAVRAAGLSAVVAQVVSDHDGRRIVMRAGLGEDQTLSAELVEAFVLLAGQATVALRNEQLLAEITEIHDELEHQALHDALTGLPNRSRLLQRLAERGTGTETRGPALLFLDLNGFKPVNDRLGHEAGDALLQLVAARLLGAAPYDALVARLGGDEFTVLLGDVTRDAAIDAARAVVAAIRNPYEIGRDTVQISTSVGVAFDEPGLGEAELIRRADVAMYAAKRGRATGHEPIEIYRPELDVTAERRAVLTGAMAHALGVATTDESGAAVETNDSGEITLAFQPIFDVSGDQRLLGAEALVRWRHPLYGDVPPGEIVELARVADHQDDLHRHIVTAACRRAAQWHAADPVQRIFITVNASPDELGSSGLIGNVRDALAASGLPAELLFVEISERLVSPPSEAVIANVVALRELGVGLLLDDFGQGNASLSYLHDLPLAGIKLDRRLVVNSLRSDADRIVLETIVDLSAKLGHLVIAEGIETAQHVAAIVGAGCMLAQGYHLGRPGPAGVIDGLVEAGLVAAANEALALSSSLSASLSSDGGAR